MYKYIFEIVNGTIGIFLSGIIIGASLFFVFKTIDCIEEVKNETTIEQVIDK